MIRNLLAATAVATVVAAGASAQQAPSISGTGNNTHTTAPSQPARPVQAEGYLASKFIGQNIYNGTEKNAQSIGNVNDLVLDKTGMVKSVVIGVGGFLGIGEKDVAIAFPKVSWTEDNGGNRRLVINATKEQLQAMPAFDRKAYSPGESITGSISAGGNNTTPNGTAK
jgi:sporulation protein YlmC with PRC-barrel domain